MFLVCMAIGAPERQSFLHQLYGCFTGYKPSGEQLPKQITNLWGKGWRPSERHVVIWFEAWRYQHEATPVVALLHEVRGQWAWYRKTVTWIQKISEVAVRGALLVVDEATQKIDQENSIKLKPSASGIQMLGEKWEQDHFDSALPSQKLRKYLSEAINVLVGEGRLVILVDDLDRCQPEAACKLLEGIKIYLNLPNCVFVLAMDQRQLERAIAQCLPGKQRPESDKFQIQQAHEYLEKICQDVWQLPLLPLNLHQQFLQKCLEGHLPNHESVVKHVFGVLKAKPFLPANARKLKAYGNTLRRFIEHCKPLANSDSQKHARLLVIMSCLYQFHTDLYRLLESNPRFYNEILEWLKNGTSNKLFEHIDVAVTVASTAKANFVLFPDPATGNVFRIRELVEYQGSVTEDEVKNYLLPYARA